MTNTRVVVEGAHIYNSELIEVAVQHTQDGLMAN